MLHEVGIDRCLPRKGLPGLGDSGISGVVVCADCQGRILEGPGHGLVGEGARGLVYLFGSDIGRTSFIGDRLVQRLSHRLIVLGLGLASLLAFRDIGLGQRPTFLTSGLSVRSRAFVRCGPVVLGPFIGM